MEVQKETTKTVVDATVVVVLNKEVVTTENNTEKIEQNLKGDNKHQKENSEENSGTSKKQIDKKAYRKLHKTSFHKQKTNSIDSIRNKFEDTKNRNKESNTADDKTNKEVDKNKEKLNIIKINTEQDRLEEKTINDNITNKETSTVDENTVNVNIINKEESIVEEKISNDNTIQKDNTIEEKTSNITLPNKKESRVQELTQNLNITKEETNIKESIQNNKLANIQLNSVAKTDHLEISVNKQEGINIITNNNINVVEELTLNENTTSKIIEKSTTSIIKNSTGENKNVINKIEKLQSQLKNKLPIEAVELLKQKYSPAGYGYPKLISSVSNLEQKIKKVTFAEEPQKPAISPKPKSFGVKSPLPEKHVVNIKEIASPDVVRRTLINLPENIEDYNQLNVGGVNKHTKGAQDNLVFKFDGKTEEENIEESPDDIGNIEEVKTLDSSIGNQEVTNLSLENKEEQNKINDSLIEDKDKKIKIENNQENNSSFENKNVVSSLDVTKNESNIKGENLKKQKDNDALLNDKDVELKNTEDHKDTNNQDKKKVDLKDKSSSIPIPKIRRSISLNNPSKSTETVIFNKQNTTIERPVAKTRNFVEEKTSPVPKTRSTDEKTLPLTKTWSNIDGSYSPVAKTKLNVDEKSSFVSKVNTTDKPTSPGLKLKPAVPKKPIRFPEIRPKSAIHIPIKKQQDTGIKNRPLSNIETKNKNKLIRESEIVYADPEDIHLIVRRSSSEDSEEELNKVKDFLDGIDTMEKKEKKKRSSSFRKILTGGFFSKDKKKEEKKTKDGKNKKVDNHVLSENVQNESNFTIKNKSSYENPYVDHAGSSSYNAQFDEGRVVYRDNGVPRRESFRRTANSSRENGNIVDYNQSRKDGNGFRQDFQGYPMENERFIKENERFHTNKEGIFKNTEQFLREERLFKDKELLNKGNAQLNKENKQFSKDNQRFYNENELSIEDNQRFFENNKSFCEENGISSGFYKENNVFLKDKDGMRKNNEAFNKTNEDLLTINCDAKLEKTNIDLTRKTLEEMPKDIPKKVEDQFAQMHINKYNKIRNNFDCSEGYVDMDANAKENLNCKYIDSSSSNTSSHRSDTYENALIAQAEMLQRRDNEIKLQQNERLNARHRFFNESQSGNSNTPPRAHDTYQNVQLIKPKALIPINSERPLPNPYHNGHPVDDEKMESDVETNISKQGPPIDIIEVGGGTTVKKQESDYGTVYDLKSVPAQMVISRSSQGLTNSKDVSLNLEANRPMSPNSIEGRKLRLPSNREKVELQPRIKSPIPQTKISTDKIIATELLKNKKEDKRSTPSHQRLEIEIDYPEGFRKSIALSSPRSLQMSPKSTKSSSLSPRSRFSIDEGGSTGRMKSPIDRTNQNNVYIQMEKGLERVKSPVAKVIQFDDQQQNDEYEARSKMVEQFVNSPIYDGNRTRENGRNSQGSSSKHDRVVEDGYSIDEERHLSNKSQEMVFKSAQTKMESRNDQIRPNNVLPTNLENKHDQNQPNIKNAFDNNTEVENMENPSNLQSYPQHLTTELQYTTNQNNSRLENVTPNRKNLPLNHQNIILNDGIQTNVENRTLYLQSPVRTSSKVDGNTQNQNLERNSPYLQSPRTPSQVDGNIQSRMSSLYSPTRLTPNQQSLYNNSPVSLSPRSLNSGRYSSSQEMRPMTPLNTSQNLSMKLHSPSKAEMRQHVEAYCWKELKKLKEREENEIYQLQVSSYGYAEDPIVRRCRSVSPTSSRGKRSLSLPRSTQKAQRVRHQTIPENTVQNTGYIASTLPPNQQQMFLRNSPQRSTIGTVYKHGKGNDEGDYRPIFKRGSLTSQILPEAVVNLNKKVSFPHGQVQNAQQWPTKNGFTQSPPTRRLEKRESYLEDDVFIPASNQEEIYGRRAALDNRPSLPMDNGDVQRQNIRPNQENAYGSLPIQNMPENYGHGQTEPPRRVEDVYGQKQMHENPYGFRQNVAGQVENVYGSKPIKNIPGNGAFQQTKSIRNEDPYGSIKNNLRPTENIYGSSKPMRNVNEDPYASRQNDPRQVPIKNLQENLYGSRQIDPRNMENIYGVKPMRNPQENPYGARPTNEEIYGRRHIQEDPYGTRQDPRKLEEVYKTRQHQSTKLDGKPVRTIPESPYGSRPNDPRLENPYGSRPNDPRLENNHRPMEGQYPTKPIRTIPESPYGTRQNDPRLYNTNQRVSDQNGNRKLQPSNSFRRNEVHSLNMQIRDNLLSKENTKTMDNQAFSDEKRLYQNRPHPNMESPYGSRPSMIMQESPYGSRQSFTGYATKPVDNPIYIQRQVTVNNKVCDMYGKIHEPVMEKGVLYGQLSPPPPPPSNIQRGYPPLPPGSFIRGSRLTSSANDMYRRHPGTNMNMNSHPRRLGPVENSQIVYESRVTVTTHPDFDNRPLPPIPNEPKSKFFLMRRESTRRYAPVYDDTSSETSEVQRIMSNAPSKKTGK